MFSRARVLLVAIVVALFAWMLGYGMGGGFRIGGKGAADSSDEAAAHGSGTAGRRAGLHDGAARTAEDTLSDQIAARRLPWTRERLLKSVGSIQHEPDQLHAIHFWTKLTEQLGAEDFPLALDVLEDGIKGTGKPRSLNENDVLRNKLREQAIMRWAELKPEAAAEYLKAQPFEPYPSNTAYEGIAALCGVWATSDPDAALKWAKTLPTNRAEQSVALQFILKATARRDVDAAIALARANDPALLTNGTLGNAITEAVGFRDPEQAARKIAEIGSSSVENAAGMWDSKDHDAALKWAQEIPDEKIRENALRGVWFNFAQYHPDESAVLLSKLPADGSKGFAYAAEHVVDAKMEKDPENTIRWAEALLHPEARKSAFAALGQYYGRDYGRENFDVGVQWLGNLPDGEERDSAINRFVFAGSKHPEVRSELAASTQGAECRQDTVQRAFDEWSRTDAAAARKWFQASPNISEEERQTLFKKK